MFDKHLMKLDGMRRTMILLAGLAILQALFVIGQALSLSKVVISLWGKATLASQVPLLLVFVLSFLGRNGVIYIRDKYLDDFAYQKAKQLRENLLQNVFKTGPRLLQKMGTGHMTTVTLEGVDQVETYIHLTLAKIVNMMVIPVLILLAVAVLDLSSAGILLLVFPVIILFMAILGLAAKSKADRQYSTFKQLSNHFVDSMRGLDTLKFFGLSKAYGRGVFESSERFRKATMQTLRIAILSTFALDFFTTLSTAIVAFFLGLRLLEGHILFLPALSVLVLTPEYFLPIREYASDYHATLDGKNAMIAIQEVLDEKIEDEQKSLPKWDQNSQLVISNMTFAYDSKQAIFNNLELAFNGYERVALLGLSGNGKSTLINLLAGFLQPDEAEIDYDGKRLSHLAYADFQEQIAYIPQHPYIFNRSLRDNVAFYVNEASDAAIHGALDLVGLSDFTDLDQLLGESGRQLSGGQAHRVALARVLLDDKRKIWLFDEPTAHLDIETELALKAAMLPLMKDKLVIFATHRLHWASSMDRVLVLKEGTIVTASQEDLKGGVDAIFGK